ncbi:MAG: DEAD/DEAH box helicase family protein [Planctomycetes bacterium]|nr:DEAD/DEAH box helicase family protein [Planctomycetota bacterium]
MFPATKLVLLTSITLPTWKLAAKLDAVPTTPKDRSLLDAPLTTIAGIGARRAEALRARFDLHRVRDLLSVRPLGYDGAERIGTLSRARDGGSVVLEGVVDAVSSWLSRGRLWVCRVHLIVEGERLEANFFHQRWLKDRLQQGDRIHVKGKLSGKRLDSSRLLDPRDLVAGAGLTPRYPVVTGVPPRSLRSWIQAALDHLSRERLETAVPKGSRFHAVEPDRAQAYVWLHAPRDEEQVERARRRLALEELARLRVKVGARHASETRRAHRIEVDDELDRRILRRLPFEPTADQRRAMDAVRADLQRDTANTRLLIGDVGTGKTAVAFYGLLAAIGIGREACLVAPTEALAHQHAETFREWLRGSRTKVELVTGQRRARGRAATSTLFVGTHALMHGSARTETGFCVIDEQHRFGTRQKTRLAARHPRAHVLSMTATPIPRTLAHALWGSVAISTLKEKPPGRLAVETGVWDRDEQLEAVLADVERDLFEQRGLALWICPRVGGRTKRQADESTPSVLERARALEARFAGLAVRSIHGRLPAAEREARIRAFRDGSCRVLVASSVIEVGMDFPEATRLVIEGAERFGLIQLHQMRGRIGRGARGGRVHVLVAGDKREALSLLETERDGEVLALVDLRQRGPGALLGERQHGLLRGRFFDWRLDLDLLESISEEGEEW